MVEEGCVHQRYRTTAREEIVCTLLCVPKPCRTSISALVRRCEPVLCVRPPFTCVRLICTCVRVADLYVRAAGEDDERAADENQRAAYEV